MCVCVCVCINICLCVCLLRLSSSITIGANHNILIYKHAHSEHAKKIKTLTRYFFACVMVIPDVDTFSYESTYLSKCCLRRSVPKRGSKRIRYRVVRVLWLRYTHMNSACMHVEEENSILCTWATASSNGTVLAFCSRDAQK